VAERIGAGLSRAEQLDTGNIRLRHGFIGAWPFPDLCKRCGYAKGNRRHRLGSRCSVCFRYFRHYELDSSRRCDECRP